MSHYIELVRFDDQKIIKRLGPMSSLRQTERVESGIEINIDRDKYFTRIITKERRQ